MYQVQVFVFLSISSVLVCEELVGYPYEYFQPKRILSTVPNWIPNIKAVTIKPVDIEEIRRSTHNLPPINPDAEAIFLPLNVDKLRFDQVMERSSLGGIYYNKKPKSHKKKNKFNMLNFDAYVVKPTNFNYKKVFATLKPETERILKYLNETVKFEKKEDDKFNSGKHRNSKKRKKKNKTIPPWLYSKQLNASIPTGMAFFETNNRKNLRTQPTYSPLPINYPFRRSFEHHSDPKSLREIKNRVLHVIHTEPSAQQSIRNEVRVHAGYSTLPKQANDYHPEENRHSSVFKVMPEMFKFTLEDAITDPSNGDDNEKHGGSIGVNDRRDANLIRIFPSPVTDHSSERSTLSTRVVEQYVHPVTYQPRTLDQPTVASPVESEGKQYASNLSVTKHIVIVPTRQRNRSYGHLKFFNPMTASSRVVFREQKIPYPKPTTITTEVSFTEDNPTSDIITNSPSTFRFPSTEMPQFKFQSMKLDKKSTRKNVNKPVVKGKTETKQNPRKSRRNNLEVTGSYSRQRTQGTADREKSTKPSGNEAKETEKNSENRVKGHQKQESVASSDPVQQTTEMAPSEVKHYHDIYIGHLSPFQMEYGHIMENPSGWEERFEKKDMKLHRYQGKVKWNDKKGGFGEHFYDLNHHVTE